MHMILDTVVQSLAMNKNRTFTYVEQEGTSLVLVWLVWWVGWEGLPFFYPRQVFVAVSKEEVLDSGSGPGGVSCLFVNKPAAFSQDLVVCLVADAVPADKSPRPSLFAGGDNKTMPPRAW